MEVYIHPAVVTRPNRDMQRILDDIKRETGLVDCVTDKGAMLVQPETGSPFDSLSMENCLRLKNYQNKLADRHKGINFELEIF